MTNIPQRLSAETSDPFEKSWLHRVRVFLDGVEQTECVQYDVPEGFVLRYATKDGQPIVRGDSFVVERVRGTVTVQEITQH